MTPNEDDEDAVDTVFAQMMDGLNLNPQNIAATPVATLSRYELSKRFIETRNKLHQMGELLNPKTPLGQDLQAEYHAYLLEMHKRGLR